MRTLIFADNHADDIYLFGTDCQMVRLAAKRKVFTDAASLLDFIQLNSCNVDVILLELNISGSSG